MIKDAKLIVWDEGPMSHKYLLEGLDRTLRDVMENDKIFGGKTVIISGDFRQVLPVIKKASRAQITSAALNKSKLWKHFRIRFIIYIQFDIKAYENFIHIYIYMILGD